MKFLGSNFLKSFHMFKIWIINVKINTVYYPLSYYRALIESIFFESIRIIWGGLNFLFVKKLNGNRGFKLYYEIFDPTFLTNCPSDPVITTTPSGLSTTTKKPSDLTNLQASKTFKLQVCKGENAKTITAPENFLIYIEKLENGVTESMTCDEYSPTHCLTPAVKTCNLAGKLIGFSSPHLNIWIYLID